MKAHLPRLALAAGVLVAVLAAAVIALGAVNGDAPAALRPATDAEARAALDALVAAGTSDNPASVCGQHAASIPTCLRLLRSTGAGPGGAPTIVEEREVPSREIDGGLVQGGRLLTLCGARADGSPYRTEVLMWVDGEDVVALHPVWWSGVSVVTEGVQALGDGRVGAIATTVGSPEPTGCPT